MSSLTRYCCDPGVCNDIVRILSIVASGADQSAKISVSESHERDILDTNISFENELVIGEVQERRHEACGGEKRNAVTNWKVALSNAEEMFQVLGSRPSRMNRPCITTSAVMSKGRAAWKQLGQSSKLQTSRVLPRLTISRDTPVSCGGPRLRLRNVKSPPVGFD